MGCCFCRRDSSFLCLLCLFFVGGVFITTEEELTGASSSSSRDDSDDKNVFDAFSQMKTKKKKKEADDDETKTNSGVPHRRIYPRAPRDFSPFLRFTRRLGLGTLRQKLSVRAEEQTVHVRLERKVSQSRITKRTRIEKLPKYNSRMKSWTSASGDEAPTIQTYRNDLAEKESRRRPRYLQTSVCFGSHIRVVDGYGRRAVGRGFRTRENEWVARGRFDLIEYGSEEEEED